MDHTRSTIGHMSKLARDGMHDYRVRQLATRIVHDVPSKDIDGELRALYRWVRDNVRYRFDPVELELVQAPHVTIEEQAGDCDDMSVLIAALAGALGHPWQFRTVGAQPDVQQHVALEVWNRQKWLSLDPVLEPRQPTTAPRADVGMFGYRAVGSDILWDMEGQMLSGPRRKRGRVHVQAYTRRFPPHNHLAGALGAPVPLELVPLMSGALGGPVGAREAELWWWAPYYPPAEPARDYGPFKPQGGVYPTPDLAYRSPDAPGRTGGVSNAVIFQMPKGTVPESELNGLGYYPGPVVLGNLGVGFLKKVKRGLKKVGKGIVHGVQKVGQTADKLTHTGIVRKIEKGIQDVANKTQVLKPFVMFHEKVAAPLTEMALKSVGLIKRKPRAKVTVKNALTYGAGVAASLVPGAGAAVSSALTSALPVVATAALPAAAKVVAKAAPKVLAKAAPKLAAKVVPKVASAIVPKLVVPKLPTLAKPVAKPVAAKPAFKKPPVAALKGKYPANARMLWDRQIAKFRVFVPAGGVHGLGRTSFPVGRSGIGRVFPPGAGFGRVFPPGGGFGAIRPTVTFSFGELFQPHERPEVVQKAIAAINAITAFAKSHGGQAPAVRMPAVQAFQVVELGLTTDALYGSNTKAALEYYVPGAKLPTPAKAMQGKVTWKAPSKPVAKPVAQPAKPVVAKPTTPAGYKEVGQEAQNPGLPPVGYEEHTGTAIASKEQKIPVPPKPKPKPIQRTPVVLPPPGPNTTDRARTDAGDKPNVYGPKPVSPGDQQPKEIIVDHPRIVDVTTPPLPDVDVKPLPPWPITHDAQGGSSFEPEADHDWMLWAAVGYVWWMFSHKRDSHSHSPLVAASLVRGAA